MARSSSPVHAETGAVDQAERERLEKSFWTDDPHESPGAASLRGFAQKMSEAQVVLEKLGAHAQLLRDAGTILEIGGGQGWVSCMLRRELGADKTIISSDIAPDAIASLPEWERVFRVEIDGGLACRSYEIPLRASSVDLVIVFAAAHHFGAHRRTLCELERVLSPGGRALYLHEPVCRQFFHRAAHRRVMAKRPVVPEDVLVPSRLVELARAAGLSSEVLHAPTTTCRGAKETIYYYALQRIPPLQNLLPCSVDIIFTKPGKPGDAGLGGSGGSG